MTGQAATRAPFQAPIRWSNFEADLVLIPPLAEGFGVYRGTERARQWALRHRYYLAGGVPRCAHGIYLMDSCPSLDGACGFGGAGLDHTTIWVPADEPYRPFILTHPYVDEVPESLRAYAWAHGLAVSTSPHDGWHNDRGGSHALPIRLTVTDTGSATWPLANRAVVLAAANAAVQWPDDMDEDGLHVCGRPAASP